MKTIKYMKRLVYLAVAGVGGFYTATVIYPTVASKYRVSSFKILIYYREEIQPNKTF